MVGPGGQCGLPVAALAEAEVRPEDELAQHLHLPMVGLTVRAMVRRERLASYKTAVSIMIKWRKLELISTLWR